METQRKETLLVQDNRDPRAYELMTILLPDMPEEETAAAVERLAGHITGNGGQIKDTSIDSPWGRRRLAYTMRFQGIDYRDGFYVLSHFSATPESISEIERELKLDNQVIRYLLLIDDPNVGERHRDESQETGEEEAPAANEPAQPQAAEPAQASEGEQAPAADEPLQEQVAETAETIEGEENPAPADAPADEEAPAPRRTASSKLPDEGEGTDWVAGDGTDNIPEGFPLKGTTSSKIYHPSESPNYRTTTAEIYFASPEAAERHGYRLPKVLQNAEPAAAGAPEEE